MRIGLIAPPWIPVPPPGYGGTERVVDDLARALDRRGHDVHLFTVGESTCPVRRHWLYGDAVQPTGSTEIEAAHVLAAYDALRSCDVIHDHTLLGPLLWAETRLGPRVITTNHAPFSDALRRIYRALARRVDVVAISRSHRAAAPDVPVRAVVHHGVDLDAFARGPGDGGYLLFVGRMNPDKGVHHSIDIARAHRLPLVIVTKMWEQVERDYFDSCVQPLLGSDVDVRVDIGQAERITLLRHAVALVNPIGWREPFGLVMAEALSCGTPVLTTRQGAAPEIVDDGRTGYVVDDAAALTRVDIGAIDRAECRAAAESRFSMERMARDYERLYARPQEPEVSATSSAATSRSLRLAR